MGFSESDENAPSISMKERAGFPGFLGSFGSLFHLQTGEELAAAGRQGVTDGGIGVAETLGDLWSPRGLQAWRIFDDVTDVCGERLVKVSVSPLKVPTDPLETVGSSPATAYSTRLETPSPSGSSLGPCCPPGTLPFANVPVIHDENPELPVELSLIEFPSTTRA
jgi:hypothetical protein